MSDPEAWREERRRAAQEHAAAAERRRSAEAAEARGVVAEFVRAARERELPVTALRARAYGGGTTYRTRRQGWYVRRNRSLAVGTDGEFYVLSVPDSLRARLLGADVVPDDPPLVIGRGGGDGETIGLRELLQLRLEAGADFPA